MRPSDVSASHDSMSVPMGPFFPWVVRIISCVLSKLDLDDRFKPPLSSEGLDSPRKPTRRPNSNFLPSTTAPTTTIGIGKTRVLLSSLIFSMSPPLRFPSVISNRIRPVGLDEFHFFRATHVRALFLAGPRGITGLFRIEKVTKIFVNSFTCITSLSHHHATYLNYKAFLIYLPRIEKSS